MNDLMIFIFYGSLAYLAGLGIGIYFWGMKKTHTECFRDGYRLGAEFGVRRVLEQATGKEYHVRWEGEDLICEREDGS